MEDKKHIDRLFQEKLKDFEVFPDAEIWKNIEEQLVKKKKRRIVPLWIRLGSAAAILLLLVSSGIWMFSSEKSIPKLPNTDSIITDINIKEKQDNLKNIDKPYIEKQEEVVKIDEKNVIIPLASSSQQKNNILKNANENSSAVAVTNIKAKNTSSNALKEGKIFNETNNVAQLENEEKGALKEKLENINSLETSEKMVASTIKLEDTQKNQGKKDINDALKENEAVTLLEKKNSNDKKWSVGSTVSPIYYNTLGKGSPIHSSLSENEKNSITSVSYGIKVNYKINKKLSLQSGINSLDLAYQTKNVTALVTSTNGLSNDTNINTNIQGIKIITVSNNNNAVAQDQELTSSRQRGNLANLNGDLNQSLSYVEVPMEAKYTILQKKLGVNIIGGLSTYLLYNKGVTLQNENGSTVLGEASNINDVNFSGNVGLDVDYNINKKLYINVSPMFKYQFNTFSKNDGGFKPYYLGIYTGLNFRF